MACGPQKKAPEKASAMYQLVNKKRSKQSLKNNFSSLAKGKNNFSKIDEPLSKIADAVKTSDRYVLKGRGSA